MSCCLGLTGFPDQVILLRTRWKFFGTFTRLPCKVREAIGKCEDIFEPAALHGRAPARTAKFGAGTVGWRVLYFVPSQQLFRNYSTDAGSAIGCSSCRLGPLKG